MCVWVGVCMGECVNGCGCLGMCVWVNERMRRESECVCESESQFMKDHNSRGEKQIKE